MAYSTREKRELAKLLAEIADSDTREALAHERRREADRQLVAAELRRIEAEA